MIHDAIIAVDGGPIGLRNWEPENPDAVMEMICVRIGEKKKKGSDEFYIRVTTPLGIARYFEDADNPLTMPIVILKRYDFDTLWNWLEKTVASCEGVSWEQSVVDLQRYFRWEYHDYRTG